jgi:hypothetical protein
MYSTIKKQTTMNSTLIFVFFRLSNVKSVLILWIAMKHKRSRIIFIRNKKIDKVNIRTMRLFHVSCQRVHLPIAMCIGKKKGHDPTKFQQTVVQSVPTLPLMTNGNRLPSNNTVQTALPASAAVVAAGTQMKSRRILLFMLIQCCH